MPQLPEEWRVVAHFCAGGVAGMAARTVIAPIERVKIIYQTRPVGEGQMGWTSVLGKVVRGVVAVREGCWLSGKVIL